MHWLESCANLALTCLLVAQTMMGVREHPAHRIREQLINPSGSSDPFQWQARETQQQAYGTPWLLALDHLDAGGVGLDTF
jgi:hypothetical protein